MPVAPAGLLRKRARLPSDVPGLGCWLAGWAITGVAADAAVASWPDVSFTRPSAVQASGPAQPLYRLNALNGYPGVEFQGTDDVLVTAANAAFDAARQITVLAVVKQTGGTTGRIVSFNWAGGFTSSNDGAGIVQLSTTQLGGWYRTSAGSFNSSGPTGQTASVWHLVTMFNENDTFGVRGYCDGTPGNPSANASGTPTTHVGISLGAGAGANFWTGIIAEVIAWPRRLSGREVGAMQRYLAGRYALVSRGL